MSERLEPQMASDERTTLVEFLDYFRATIAWKVEGLDDNAAASQPLAPSRLSLLGLVRHLTDVEQHWFRTVFRGDMDVPHYWSDDGDSDFDLPDGATLAGSLDAWLAEVERARVVVADVSDLGTLAARRAHGEAVSLRWILVHMIEEYARHCGHADLLREHIDGSTGD